MENPRTAWRFLDRKIIDKWSVFQPAMFDYRNVPLSTISAPWFFQERCSRAGSSGTCSTSSGYRCVTQTQRLWWLMTSPFIAISLAEVMISQFIRGIMTYPILVLNRMNWPGLASEVSKGRRRQQLRKPLPRLPPKWFSIIEIIAPQVGLPKVGLFLILRSSISLIIFILCAGHVCRPPTKAWRRNRWHQRLLPCPPNPLMRSSPKENCQSQAGTCWGHPQETHFDPNRRCQKWYQSDSWWHHMSYGIDLLVWDLCRYQT